MTKRTSRAKPAKRSAAARQSTAVKRSNGAKHANGKKRGNGRTPATEHHATYRPSRKTVGATVGSAVSGLAIFAASRYWHITITPEVASMIAVAATFAVGWVVPPSAREAIIETARGHRMAFA
jgi:hypothetical protein